MGFDYCRFRSSNDAAVLEPLIQSQAVAFQSMWGWDARGAYDIAHTSNAILSAIHHDSYIEASNKIRALVEFFDFDDTLGTATDIPDLDTCWRVTVIANNAIFPPLWRVQAYRTILHHHLPDQITQWRNWAAEVANGKHDRYIKWLHLHDTVDFLRYHWSCLRRNATSSLSKSANWANSPEIDQIRREIIQLEEPCIVATPILPSECEKEVDGELYDGVMDLVTRINNLSRLWNRRAKVSSRLPNYSTAYCTTLDEFRRGAKTEWLANFFTWAERCAETGFSLFLDY